MKKVVLFLMIGVLSINLNAQDENSEQMTEEKVNKNSLAVSAGLPGFGVEYARKLSTKFSGRLRYNFFKLTDYDPGEIDLSGNKVSALINGESNTVDILLEYAPFGGSFKLVGGIGILNKMDLNMLLEYDESVTFGDVVLTKEDYGQLIADLSWQGVAPYLGLGWGRAVPKSGFGFAVEFGTYFTSSPEVTLTATKLLAPTADQEEEFAETFETWKYVPSIKFRLAYSF
jgi:hypothetical protein